MIATSGRKPENRALVFASLISFGLHAGLAAVSSSWTFGGAAEATEEQEWLSFRVRLRSGEQDGLDDAELSSQVGEQTTESTDAHRPDQDAASLAQVEAPEFQAAPTDDVRFVGVRSASQPLPASDSAGATLDAVPSASQSEKGIVPSEPTLRGDETEEHPVADSMNPAVSQPSSGEAGAPDAGREPGQESGAHPRLGVPAGATVGTTAGELSTGDIGPLLLDAPRPRYPTASIRGGEEGSVLCAMHVDTRGHVLDVDVLRSSGHRRLDEAAVSALSTWRFEPARKLGQVVPARIQHQVNFRLE